MTSGVVQPAARQIAHRRGLRRQLVERDADELDEHHLDHRLQAADRGADRGAHEAHFGDRRVDDAVRAVLLKQSVGTFERAARFRDVLAHAG